MDNNVNIAIGMRIRKLRNEKTGLSQEKFANKVGLDRTYFSAIELGKHSATVSVLSKVAQGLGISLEELFRGT